MSLRLEYSGRRPFAQPRRAADPRFHGLLLEIGRWLLDLDELPELARRVRLVGVNRRNVVSFRDRDHFGGDRPVKTPCASSSATRRSSAS